jgi:VIT1/CCC1 family predicted Fe2+/Mn2+ transporter
MTDVPMLGPRDLRSAAPEPLDAPHVALDMPGWSSTARQAAVREVLMGAQDNLTNVLAVMLGVAIGAGRGDLVALACLSAAVAEAVSMGGVLYSATRAERNQRSAAAGVIDGPVGLSPVASGLTTFAAALIGGLIPLAPFVAFPLPAAVAVSIAVSLVALFALGSWTGRASGAVWWRDGVRLVLIAGVAAVAAAVVGTMPAVD